jgi:hypothetical protein
LIAVEQLPTPAIAPADHRRHPAPSTVFRFKFQLQAPFFMAACDQKERILADIARKSGKKVKR